MSPLRLNGSTSGFSQLDAPAVAGDQTFTLPGTGGTLDRLNRAGNILQVVQATKTDVFTTTSSAMTDVTGLSVSITPSFASSKILVLMNVSVGGGNGSDVNHVGVQMVRNSTAIHIGDARGTRTRATSVVNTSLAGQMFHTNGVYLDSPNTTNATTYKIQINTTNTSFTACVNRSGRDFNDPIGYDGTGASSITVMEVAA